MVMLKKMRPLNQAIISVEYDYVTRMSILVADLDTHKLKTKPMTGRYSTKSARRVWDNNRNVFTEMVTK